MKLCILLVILCEYISVARTYECYKKKTFCFFTNSDRVTLKWQRDSDNIYFHSLSTSINNNSVKWECLLPVLQRLWQGIVWEFPCVHYMSKWTLPALWSLLGGRDVVDDRMLDALSYVRTRWSEGYNRHSHALQIPRNLNQHNTNLLWGPK